jgi:FtsP/CotA-like multicopper oxidase with cupredoxin domain
MKSGVGLILAAVVGLAHGPTVDRSVDTLPTIRFNDNLEAAGRLESGVLTLRLEVQRGVWRLLGPEEPGAEVLAFAEQGETPQIPGPMIRAPLGTEIRVIVRNPLETPLVLHGLSARRVAAMDSVVVPGGEVREVRFTVDAVGTYYYWGTTTGASFRQRHYEDSPLSGALIVDPPGSSDPQRDRVFLMGLWIGGKDEEGNPDDGSTFLVINGRPWPLTERLTYDMGDSVRWRIINATQRVHPMHLHGFFYRVDARGDIARDSVYWPGQQRMAVTELMRPGTTMSLAWSPNRPGGWVFHCHLNWHVVANASLGADRETGEERFQHLLRGHHDGDPNNHVVEGMGGLMLGIFVRPPEGWVPHEPKRRELRLFVNSDSAAGDERPVFAYILQEGDAEPAPDSILIPGSPLVLWEGEPTSVTVINRTGEATQVHWHGLEIESYYDGVTGVGGYPGRLTPNILPGDSFEMRITPPRAGSYMYHTHVNDIRQQTAGLYGAFVVLEEGDPWDPDTDRVLLLSNSRSFDVLLNGTTEPEPTTFRVGTAYRLRFMNVTVQNARIRFRLVRDDAPVRWRPLAKDGYDLPPHQTAPLAADQTVSIGDTFDFEYVPNRAGELHLEVRTGGGRLLVDQIVQVIEDEDAVSAPAGTSRQ